MNNKPLICLFEENELNISTLYSIYSQKISDKKEFWEKLSNEEISHAAQIGTQKENSDAIEENKFSRGVIKYVMDFVLNEIKRAQEEEIDHHEALLTALRIEQSMLERKCFEMFAPSNQRLKEVLCRMNSETERHVQKLLTEIKKNKFPLK